MAAPRQGLPVRLDRAPQRGAAFAITRASRRARTRSIGSRSRARGSSLIFRSSPPPSLLRRPLALLITLSPATTACPPSVGVNGRGECDLRSKARASIVKLTVSFHLNAHCTQDETDRESP